MMAWTDPRRLSRSHRSSIHGLFALTVVAGLAMVSPIAAQPGADPNHILAFAGGLGYAGGIATVDIEYYNLSSSSVDGWAYAVQHDTADLTLVGVSIGADVLSANGGAFPDFYNVDYYPTGFTVGAILDLNGVVELPTGVNVLNQVDYQVLMPVGGISLVYFTNTLGTPPFTPIVVIDGASAILSYGPGSVVSLENPGYPEFIPTFGSNNEIQVPVGATSFFVDVSLQQFGGPTILPISSLYLAFDDFIGVAPFEAVNVEAIGELAAINGGQGPEELYIENWEYDTFTSGWTVHTRLDAPPVSTPSPIMTFAVSKEIVRIEFALNLPIPAGTTIAVECNTFPYSSQAFGPLGFAPIGPGCVFEVSFYDPPPAQIKRGDCNQDGTFDIGDAISGLSFLFSGGLPGDCQDSCDTNDDGLLDIADPISGLSALFAGGVLPPSPGPQVCGPDPSPDGLDCVAYLCQ